MSGLDQVMSRLKKSPASEPQPVIPVQKKKVVEPAPLLDDEPSEEEEDDGEELEDEVDEEDEEIEEPEESKPQLAPKIVPKPIKISKVEEKPVEPSIDELQRQRAEEVQLLQNNGIYRTEILYNFGVLNKTLEEILKIIKG